MSDDAAATEEKVRVQIVTAAEVLLRQADPKIPLDDAGQPSSLAFYPWRDWDAGQLSVDRSELTTPQRAYDLFTAAPPAGFGGNSMGVWGLSVPEIEAQTLTAWQDPVAAEGDKPENPAHALVDFRGRPEKKWKDIGRKLKTKAFERGRLYPV